MPVVRTILLMGIALYMMGLVIAPTTHAQERVLHFVMWKPHQPEPWDRAIEQFEREHPGTKVEIEVGPHSATAFHALLVTKLRNEDPSIDVFLLDVVWPTEFAKAGYLLPLDEILPEEERRAFFPAAIEANTVEGRLVAAPFNIDAGLLFYRRDLLEKYTFSPPRTWAELLEQVRTIQEGEQAPALAGYSGQFDKYEGLVCNMIEFIVGAGGSLVDESGSPFLDEPAAREAIEFVRDKIVGAAAPRAVLTQREPESRAMFARGEAIFHRNWPETWNILNDPDRSEVAGKVGLTMLPAFEGHKPAAALGGWQIGVAAHTVRAEPAGEFVRFLTRFDTQKALTLSTAQSHSRMGVMDDPEVLEAFPHFSQLRAILLSAEPRPKLANYHEVSDHLQQALYTSLSGGVEDGGKAPRPLMVIAIIAAIFIVTVFLLRRTRSA